MQRPAYPCVAIVLTCLTCTTSAIAAEPAPGRPAATRPSTQPAASRATTQDAADEKLLRDVEAAAAVIPQDVRDGKREGTDEQKMIMQFALFVQLSTDTMPERIKQAEKNRENGKKQMDAALQAAEEMRAKMAKEPPALREEAEKAIAAQIKTLRLFERVTGSAITPDGTPEQVARKKAEVLRDLPRDTRELLKAGADSEYHAQRLNLLQIIHDARRQASTQPATREQSEKQAAAHQALLEALDAKYKAQQRIIEMTPLGGLDKAIIE
jgi:hypothetical protein